MANDSLLDRLVWQFRHLWQEGDKARLSVECDHEENAFASLHVDLGVQRNGRRKQQPRHTQTPSNLSCDKETDTSGLSVSLNTESAETQATQVDDTNIMVVDNESIEATLTEIVQPVPNNPSQPTITTSCWESETIEEKVGEDTEGAVI